MNIKRLFFALIALTATLVSCKEEKPVFGVSVDKDAIEFPQGGGQAQLQVTTAQAWTVKIPSNAQEWLIAEPSTGIGNATITFTASANDGKDRKIGLQIRGSDYVSIKATQPGAIKPGDGLTPETAWSASEANAWIKANLADKEVTSDKYYVKGIIHKVQTTFAASGSYGNAVFFISDNGQSASDDFEAFQVYYLGGKQWKSGQADVEVGDEVIIYGPVTLYGTTAETSGKGAAYIYSHLRNGETPSGSGGSGGDTTDYSNAAPQTVAEFIALADKNTYYKLTGKVSGFNSSYCSFDLTDDSGTIYVYSVLDAYKTDEWKNKIKNGGTITIAGLYDFYANKSQHEVVKAAILSYEGGSSSSTGEPKGTGTQADPFNADGAIKCVKDNGDKETSGDYYVKGKVSAVKYYFDVEHGTATFDISDDGSKTATQFTCYGVLFLGNTMWVDGNTQIAVGDEVICCGHLTNYSGTYEIASKTGYIYSLNGKTSESTGPSFGVKKTDISVGATATEAVISITGNVAWTASSSDVTLDVSSGEGAKDIKATFAANTDTEKAKTYKVTVSTTADVSAKSIEVTITQGKASSGNGLVVDVSFIEMISDLPQASANGIKDGSYTLSGYTFVMHAADKFYQAKSGDNYYLLIGKKDSYIELPAIDGKALVSVKFLTGAGASENVIIDLAKKDGTLLGVNKEKNKKGTEYEYQLTGEAGATYRIAVTNAYNAQFQTITLTYE